LRRLRAVFCGVVMSTGRSAFHQQPPFDYPWRLISSFKAAASDNLSQPVPCAFPSGLIPDVLRVTVAIPNYAGADIVSLQFNGDTTAANYQSRWITFSNIASPVVAGVDFTSTASIALGPSAITGGRIIVATIMNQLAANKIITMQEMELIANQGTAPQMAIGGGQWFNTTAQINRIALTVQGANKFGTGTTMLIEGFQP